MALIKAKLVKLVSDDGNFSVIDEIKLGTVYTVNPDTIKDYGGYNTVYKRFWVAKHIETDEGTLFPLELLELLTN